MTYSPGHRWPSSLRSVFASSRVGNAWMKCRCPSFCNLKMRKGRSNQTPMGNELLGGQWNDYYTDATELSCKGRRASASAIQIAFVACYGRKLSLSKTGQITTVQIGTKDASQKGRQSCFTLSIFSNLIRTAVCFGRVQQKLL